MSEKLRVTVYNTKFNETKKVACFQVYFLPNNMKYIHRVYVWKYHADSLNSSDIWTALDQDRTKCWAVVSTVMKVIFQKYGKFLDNFRKYILRILYFFPLDKL